MSLRRNARHDPALNEFRAGHREGRMLNGKRTVVMAAVVTLSAALAGVNSIQSGMLRLPARATSLVTNGSQVYGVTRLGDLFTLDEGRLRMLQKGFASGPLTTCRAGVAGVNPAGELRMWASSRVVTTQGADLSPLARPVCVPGGAVAVSRTGDLILYRQEGAAWREHRRTRANVMRDAHLTLADLTGSGESHVVALTGPTSTRYEHGILGDTEEATGVAVLHHQSLRQLSRLDLRAPTVFEDLEARPVELPDGRTGLALVQATPGRGAALVLIGQVKERLQIRSAGPDFGQTHRWLAPIVAENEIWAVHTPHIGGVLHRYQEKGKTLTPTKLWTGVSNHVIGSRTLTAVRLAPGLLLVPSQDQTRLVVLRCVATCSVLHEWALDATVSSNVAFTRTHVVVGDASGRVHMLAREAW